MAPDVGRLLAPFLVALSCIACGDGAGGEGDAGSGGDGATDLPAVAATPGRAEYTFRYDGLERYFIVYVPEGHVPARPLVVVLHGGGGSARQMFRGHPLTEAADERGWVVVAAQGMALDGDPASFGWNGQAVFDSGVDDVGYLTAVIVAVSDALEIDPGRRYVAGFSGGASMAVRFGAEASEHVTAIGTFAGKVGLSLDGGPFIFPAVPSTPLSVQMTYGTEDPNYEGELNDGVQATSARAGIEWWRDSLRCSSLPETATDGVLTSDTYPGCTGGTLVRMVTIEGMGHTWPELPDDPIAGTPLLFDFFDQLEP